MNKPATAPRPDSAYFNCWKCWRSGGSWEWNTDLSEPYWIWMSCSLCGGRGEVYFSDPREGQ